MHRYVAVQAQHFLFIFLTIGRQNAKKRSSNNPTKHHHNEFNRINRTFSLDVVKHALLQFFNYE